MTEKQIEQLLKDYHWMINSVLVMRENLQEVGGKLTAQYGIEAAMPKAQGGASDPVYTEVVRRSKHFKTIEGYENKIKLIQKHIHIIQDTREKEVLHWILEGKGYSWIARHMGLSHTHIKRFFSTIAKKIAKDVQDVQNVQKCI